MAFTCNRAAPDAPCWQSPAGLVILGTDWISSLTALLISNPSPMKLIVPMAGRGTRVRPHSHVTPKPLLKVKGRSVVERIVDTFAEVLPQVPDEGIFVLGPDFGQDIRDQLTALCKERGMDAHFPVQREALGTAHAVGAADKHLQGDGVVVFADTIFLREDDIAVDPDADVVAFVREVDDPRRFGIAVRDGEQVTELVEKPDDPVTNEALIGIYYVRELADLKAQIDRLIENDLRGADGEFQLTDALNNYLQEGARFTTASVAASSTTSPTTFTGAPLPTASFTIRCTSGPTRRSRTRSSARTSPSRRGRPSRTPSCATASSSGRRPSRTRCSPTRS